MQKTASWRAHLLGRPLWLVLAAIALLGSLAFVFRPSPAPPAAPDPPDPQAPRVASREPTPWSAHLDPDDSLSFSFLHGEQVVFRFGLREWARGWVPIKTVARDRAKGDRLSVRVPFVIDKDKGEVIDVQFEAWQSGPQELTFRYELAAAQDVPLTSLAAALACEPEDRAATATLTHADDKEEQIVLPVPLAGSEEATSKCALNFDQCGTVSMALDPPCPVGINGGARVVLGADKFPAGTRRGTLTLSFSEKVSFHATQADLDGSIRPMAGGDWFPFQAAGDSAPGVIDMDGWLDHPAGKHGGVRMVKDHFAFEDGTPVKFWGVNLSSSGNAPDRETAELTAARYARYGINAIRMHKFARLPKQHGIADPADTTRLEPEALGRFDYFASQMKQRGVYFGFSPTYGFRVVPSQRDRLLAYDELAKNLDGDTTGLINWAEDVQELLFDLVVKLLKHKNPYTGLTYAEEPALCFVELQNEDDIFFYHAPAGFNACPTYRKRFMERFAAWLKQRYGSEEKFATAWKDALKPNEALDAATIVPEMNPWFASDYWLYMLSGGRRRRLLDTAAFLHEVQNSYYGRFVKAIRAAGYRGPIISTPWQAPTMLPHYYNLRSDYEAGYIARHNYFDSKGPAMVTSLVTRPGSGYLGSGLEQVIDRPFVLSEWAHVYPNPYAAEGPALMGAYGLGLQGWDAAYQYESWASRRAFTDAAGGAETGNFNTDVPTSLGQYPTVARMIYRGDVKEGEVISVRRVSPGDLAEGKFSFSDRAGVPAWSRPPPGPVPPAALAAGRVVVEFADKSGSWRPPDLKPYTQGSVIRSVTGQLAWDTSGRGFFTVDTPGTKAVVGFAEGRELPLGDVTIQLHCPFASLFVTALEPGSDLAGGKRALVSALARQINTGFTYYTPDPKVRDIGRSPILLEPVKATVAITSRPIAAVNVLDHDGRRTGRTLPVTDGRFVIDGAKEKAIYYEVVFQ
jgi:hypothetical protein